MSLASSSIARWSLALACLSILAGCGAIVVGGTAATTALVSTDRRTAGEQVDDQTIELRVSSEMEKAFGDKARILGTSYAGRLLLVGDVPTEEDRTQAEAIAKLIPKVAEVDNHIRVGDITPMSVRSNDTWLTSKVKSKLINTKGVPFRTIKVTTERGVVYLLGILTPDESQRAGIVASGVEGVQKVVKLFRIVSPESLQTESAASSSGDDDTSSSSTHEPASQTDASGSGAQASPVQ